MKISEVFSLSVSLNDPERSFLNIHSQTSRATPFDTESNCDHFMSQAKPLQNDLSGSLRETLREKTSPFQYFAFALSKCKLLRQAQRLVLDKAPKCILREILERSFPSPNNHNVTLRFHFNSMLAGSAPIARNGRQEFEGANLNLCFQETNERMVDRPKFLSFRRSSSVGSGCCRCCP